VFDATISPELRQSKRNRGAMLLRAERTSGGLIDFQTFKPNAIARKRSVPAQVTAAAVAVFNPAVNSESSTRIKAPDVKARPIWARMRIAKNAVTSIFFVRAKNKWHKTVCSTAAEQYVMKMTIVVGDKSATGLPPMSRIKKHRLMHIARVPTVSKKTSAVTPAL